MQEEQAGHPQLQDQLERCEAIRGGKDSRARYNSGSQGNTGKDVESQAEGNDAQEVTSMRCSPSSEKPGLGLMKGSFLEAQGRHDRAS